MSWRRFFHRAEWDAERKREIDVYLEFETAENVARGMSEEEAQYAALRKFGNRTFIREEIYCMNSVGFLETLWQDLRYGARGLRSSPGFTAVAVLSLALGIGANAAIFQLFDAVRLRLLPVKDPKQLAEVAIKKESRGQWNGAFFGRRANLTYTLWQQIREHQQVFSEMAAWGNSSMNIAPTGEIHRVDGLYVSGNFFHVLGVTPLLGRVFDSADDRRGCGAPAAVISFAFWQREFGGKANIIGQKLTLNGQPFEVVGVTPANFFGMEVGHRFDVAVPICSQPLLEPNGKALEDRQYWWLAAIGRLKPGVSITQASAQLDVISPGIFEATVPNNYRLDSARDYRKFRLGAFPAGSGVSSLRKTYETPLILLLSIAGLVLLIACANLTNLMLARASVREREIAVRLALGASRQRLIFQLLTESLLLALVAAALGIGLAQLVSRFLILLISTSADQIFLNTTPDAHVLGFTAALAVLTGVLFGLTPALRGTRLEPNAVMKAGGRGLSASCERFGLRRILVVSQVALSLVLLAGALLFVRSLTKLLTVDPGFQQNGVLITKLNMTKLGLSTDRQRETNRELLDRLRHIPGVDAAALFSIAPATGNFSNDAITVGANENRKYKADFNWVSDGYFQTLRIPLVAGRDFDEKDTPRSPKVAVVNEAFARHCTGGANPLGMRFRVAGAPGAAEPFYEIVGVVKNTKYEGLREAFPAIIYEAESQRMDTNGEPNYFIRSGISFVALTASVRDTVSRVTPTAGLSFESFQADIRDTLLPERLMATLASCFGLLAVVLATVGLYGVMAYMVTRRRNEIGVRMALGADRRAVVSMVLREAAGLLVVGVAVGIGLTLIAARSASSLLFGVPSWDPVSLGIAVGGLVFVGVAASGVPALRASRVDPMNALREE